MGSNASTNMARPTVFRGMGLVLLLLVGAPFVKYGIVNTWGYVGDDFEVFLDAAEAITSGTSPYPIIDPDGDSVVSTQDVFGAYIYPAFFARLLTPLLALDPWHAKLVYLSVCLAVVLGILFPWKQWLKILGGERGFVGIFLPTLIATSLLFGWGPMIQNLRFGQSNLFSFALMCGSWRLIARSVDSRSRGKPFVAGVLFGLAAMVKLTPFLAIPFLAVCLQWVFLAGMAIGGVLGILLSGWDLSKEYFIEVLPAISRLPELEQSIALPTLLNRHLPGSPGTWICGFLYLALLARVFFHRKKIGLEGLVLLGAYLPTVFAGLWYHHYLLALLPLVIWVPREVNRLVDSCREGHRTRALAGTLGLALPLLLGFYYWFGVEKILARSEEFLPFTGLEIFVIGHVFVFLMLLPHRVERDERNRNGN